MASRDWRTSVVRRVAPIGILVGALTTASFHAQEAEGIGDVRSGKWMVADEPVGTATWRGATCLAVSDRVNPVLAGLRFESGTIELDMALDRPVGFLGVDLRVEADGKRFERVYIRPGASETPNAIQYDPHFNGYSNWQVYNPPLHEAAATLPLQGEWFHVKIDVERERVSVFVGDAEEPQLVVEELLSGSPAGVVRLWAGQAGAYVANVDIRPADSAELKARRERREEREREERARVEQEPAVPPTPPAGVIVDWRVSEPFLIPGDGAEGALRTDAIRARMEQADHAAWKQVQPESESGLINLNRSILDRPEGNATVLAGVLLVSEEEQTKRLLFDSAEGVVVFLNGRSLYAGNDLMDRPAWRVNPDEHVVELPLVQGRNELVLAVSSQRFGWAFLGRLSDLRGLAIQPLTGAR